MPNEAIYISADNLVSWEGMVNESTDEYINDAVVTFTLKTVAGVAVTGASAISMTYQTASDGNYHGILESTVTLTADTQYYLEIIATSGGTLVGFRRWPVVARYDA